MFLKQLTLENCQAHKKTILELGKFTVITGYTNTGKSTILRALDQFLGNPIDSCDIRKKLPDGSELPCTITGRFEDGGQEHIGIRIRSDNENSVDLDGNKSPKIKFSFPEYWTQALGIQPLAIGNKTIDVSYYPQMEFPFLVHETPGDAGKLLGILSGIGLADDLIALFNKQYRETQQQIKLETANKKTLEEKCQKATQKLEEMQKIDQINERLGDLELILQLLTVTTEVLQVKETIADLEAQFSGLAISETYLSELLDLQSKLKDTELQAQIIHAVEETKTDIQNLEQEHKELDSKIEKLEKELKLLVKEECPVCKRKAICLHCGQNAV